jgi:hypothetical protein
MNLSEREAANSPSSTADVKMRKDLPLLSLRTFGTLRSPTGTTLTFTLAPKVPSIGNTLLYPGT